MTYAHAGYLEPLCIAALRGAARYEVDNRRDERMPQVAEGTTADLEATFDKLKLLLGTLGYSAFDAPKVKLETSPSKVLTMSGRGVTAKGDLTEEGFVVFNGSQAAPKNGTFHRQAGRQNAEGTVRGRQSAAGGGLPDLYPRRYLHLPEWRQFRSFS